MTEHEALKILFEFAQKKLESIPAREAFRIGEAVGTISRGVDERCKEVVLSDRSNSRLDEEENNEKGRKTKEKALDDAR